LNIMQKWIGRAILLRRASTNYLKIALRRGTAARAQGTLQNN